MSTYQRVRHHRSIHYSDCYHIAAMLKVVGTKPHPYLCPGCKNSLIKLHCTETLYYGEQASLAIHTQLLKYLFSVPLPYLEQ